MFLLLLWELQRVYKTVKYQSSITQLDWKPLTVKKKIFGNDHMITILTTKYCTCTHRQRHEMHTSTHPVTQKGTSRGHTQPWGAPALCIQQVYKEHCWNVAQRDNNKELMDHYIWHLVSFDTKLKVGSSNQAAAYPILTPHAFPHMNFMDEHLGCRMCLTALLCIVSECTIIICLTHDNQCMLQHQVWSRQCCEALFVTYIWELCWHTADNVSKRQL